jgi:hypothetical protein
MQCKLQNQNVLLNRKTLLTVVYIVLYISTPDHFKQNYLTENKTYSPIY